jgi:hypothetical protein
MLLRQELGGIEGPTSGPPMSAVVVTTLATSTPESEARLTTLCRQRKPINLSCPAPYPLS